MNGTSLRLATLIDLQPQLLLVVLLSVLMPLSIFVGRRNVRIRRLRMLRNLKLALPSIGERDASAPGFAMIEARYLDDTEGASLWTRALAWLKETGIYALPTLVFVLVSGCGFALLFALGGDWPAAATVILQAVQVESGNAASFTVTTALVIAAGFVGAYIWSINYLILRVANFDLSPLSFLSTAAHILLTVFVAWVLRQVVAAPENQAIAVAALLGVAFLSGLYPSLGPSVLIDRLPGWLRLKRDIPEASEIGRLFPLDLIDGINAAIKFRLDSLDIADVQNLATANPVELFVETPYGFAQILDWIAQAQLLAELGPKRFLDARRLGIRDMAAFLDLGATDAGRDVLRPALASGNEPNEALRAQIESIARKLHVRQLMHWLALFSRPFDEAPPAPATDGKPIPFKAVG